MSQTEDQLFFSLLRYGLWSTPIPVDGVDLSAVNWDHILEQFLRQSLQGIGSEAVIAHKDVFGLTKEQQRPFLQQAGGITRRNLFMNADVVKLFTHLQVNGYHPVLLKGQGNATFYLNPLNRAPGDIDVYIGEKDYEQVKRDLCEFYNLPLQGNSTNEWDKHFEIFVGDTELEIHRNAVTWFQHQKQYGEALCQHWLNDVDHLDTVVINGVNIPIPSKQFNVLYLFVHLWHHFLDDGVGLRQLCDWALVLHHSYSVVDENELKNNLDQINLLSAWKLMGCVLVSLLGLPQNEFPLYDKQYEKKVPLIWKDINRVGNFGHHSDRSEIARKNRKGLSRKLLSFYYATKRYCFLMRICPKYVISAYARSLKYSFHFIKSNL